MAKNKLTNAGGKREGSGRHKKEPTKVLSVRVPLEHHAYLTEMVKTEVKRLLNLKKSI